MPLMMEKLFDALIAAHVPDDKARAAAVEAADFDSRLVMIDARLGKIESQITVLMWMVAINIALVVSTMVGMLNVMLRMPR